ncbi:9420_t:CDS:2 [Paraglomus brasilianum]|uniref:9420_t:CDS:1 n=1 Tax=Paraglomus brasilianum TaxID=144538 RepID=A0A9N9A5F4_9GLOM|nr:9420_t:CDS:2 [Paraglomus brasilianum]
MAGQSNHESYTYNIQSDQLHSMDSNCTNDLPSNQTIMDQPIIMDYNGIHSYHTSPQPPGQDSFPSDIGLFDNNGVYIGGVNESLNTENYGYVGNNENVVNCSTMNYNPPSVHYQTLVQTPPTTTPFNNAGTLANAASHGCTVIIVKADINLERFFGISKFE